MQVKLEFFLCSTLLLLYILSQVFTSTFYVVFHIHFLQFDNPHETNKYTSFFTGIIEEKIQYSLEKEKKQMASHLLLPEGVPSNIVLSINYSWIVATTPAPTVRPPSRIENLVPSSIAIGAISSTVISMLSPGITISTPSGRLQIPVTSVVRK
jgi:hypothetical protein